MLALVASDLHGSLKAAEFLVGREADLRPDLVILLGDHLYHGPRNPLPEGYSASETAAALQGLQAPVAALRGNCEAEVDELLLPWTLADSAWLHLDGRLLLAVHGHQLPENGGGLKLTPRVDVLFGHTHIRSVRPIQI
ncbi:MAG: phosphodiesterase [Deltaproteobacteria bacterium]|jgi:putative phosphoesterase|nr:phosphodiesterase [Deltaproteobacteria bacterium]